MTAEIRTLLSMGCNAAEIAIGLGVTVDQVEREMTPAAEGEGDEVLEYVGASVEQAQRVGALVPNCDALRALYGVGA